MKLTAWRIYQVQHAASAFTGDGARLFGGRFNSKGVPAIYLSSSLSLASLELLVHLQSADLLKSYLLHEVTFDQKLVKPLDPRRLPKNWRQSPPPSDVQNIGDAWIISAESAILQIPSAIISTEANYLLNPNHPDFPQIKIGPSLPHRFDPRLLKKS